MDSGIIEPEPVIWRPLDREGEIEVSYRQLPHWDQAGALTFVTFRLADSMPVSVLDRWEAEQIDWLWRNQIRDLDLDTARAEGGLPEPLRRQFLKFRQGRWHDHLDECHGECVLQYPEHAQVVAESLRKFDGRRYDLERLVVMPNHVHILVQMRSGFTLRKQCENWLRYTGRKINQAIGKRGEFWQSEPFDHIVRSSEQFEYLRKYIEDNPQKAGLKEGEYLFWRHA